MSLVIGYPTYVVVICDDGVQCRRVRAAGAPARSASPLRSGMGMG